jgi:hypothetical protein
MERFSSGGTGGALKRFDPFSFNRVTINKAVRLFGELRNLLS